MAVAVAMAVAVTVRDRGRCRSGEIYQSIEALDQRGMALIEAQDPMSFAAYQREFGNTICGQHPIAVLLQMLHRDKEKHALKFVRYAQSSRCYTCDDSSVSYASAVVCPSTVVCRA